MITCPEEGCDFKAESNQKIGLHRRHKHGYISPAAKASRKTKTSRTDEVHVVLDVLCPKGFKAEHLPIINDWIDRTRTMLKVVR